MYSRWWLARSIIAISLYTERKRKKERKCRGVICTSVFGARGGRRCKVSEVELPLKKLLVKDAEGGKQKCFFFMLIMILTIISGTSWLWTARLDSQLHEILLHEVAKRKHFVLFQLESFFFRGREILVRAALLRTGLLRRSGDVPARAIFF